MLTIGIVLYNEEKQQERIERNLALLTQYRVHCILVDNASTDDTLRGLQSLSQMYGAQLIARDENHLGAARADVVSLAQSEWVGFIDGDCVIDDAWVASALELISKNKSASAIGGPLMPGGKKAIFYSLLFKSFLGNMNSSQVKEVQGSRFVLHLPTANVLYRRQELLEVGNFNLRKARVGEDLDLSYRLAASGKKMLSESELRLIHHLPEDFSVWIRKVFTYGVARGEVGLEQKQLLTYPFLLPLLFFVFVVLNVVFFNLFRGFPVLVYGIVLLGHAVFYGRRDALKLFAHFITMHGAYSTGLLWGIFKELSRTGRAAHQKVNG